MLTDQDLAELLDDLNSDDVSRRAITLQAFWKFPSADERVLPHLERLLHDKTPCLLGIPYIFGEISWLAAKALAAEREALGIREPVYLQNVVRPLKTSDIMKAEDEANIEGRGGIEGLLENLAILRDMDKLPLYDLYLPPSPLPLDQSQHSFGQQVLTPALAFSEANPAQPVLMPVPAL